MAKREGPVRDRYTGQARRCRFGENDQEGCLINGIPKRLGVVVVVVVVALPPVPEFNAVVGKLQMPETQS